MNDINFGRVLLGGLVAGLVLNIGEYLLNEVVFVKQMEEMVSRMNLTRPGASFIAVAVVLTFILGIVIVWIYAMIRPRFGPGPKTAIIAAFVAWFCVYVYTGILNGAFLGIPSTFLVMAMLWGVIEYILAAVAGAWLYKES
jgi:hypothetical protein